MVPEVVGTAIDIYISTETENQLHSGEEFFNLSIIAIFLSLDRKNRTFGTNVNFHFNQKSELFWDSCLQTVPKVANILEIIP